MKNTGPRSQAPRPKDQARILGLLSPDSVSASASSSHTQREGDRGKATGLRHRVLTDPSEWTGQPRPWKQVWCATCLPGHVVCGCSPQRRLGDTRPQSLEHLRPGPSGREQTASWPPTQGQRAAESPEGHRLRAQRGTGSRTPAPAECPGAHPTSRLRQPPSSLSLTQCPAAQCPSSDGSTGHRQRWGSPGYLPPEALAQWGGRERLAVLSYLPTKHPLKMSPRDSEHSGWREQQSPQEAPGTDYPQELPWQRR